MKNLVLTMILAALLMAPVYGQDGNGKGEATAVENSRELLEKMDFVIEADRVVMPDGENVMVSSITNFISVQDDNAVIQISPLRGSSGPNGVGGLTVEGTTSKIRISLDKRNNVTMTMMVSGISVSAFVTITVPEDGNRAVVRIDPSYNMEDITMMGTLVPSGMSDVIQGQTY